MYTVLFPEQLQLDKSYLTVNNYFLWLTLIVFLIILNFSKLKNYVI